MSDTYGPTFLTPFAIWHHDSSSWRTSEATSLWDLELSSLTLPTWGGLHDGELYELPMPELPISGPDFSSLPTPRTSDTNGAGRHGDGGLDLRTAVTLLPTPTTQDKVGVRGDFDWDSPNQTLREVVTLLPTPNAADGNGGGRLNSRGHQRTLPGTVRDMTLTGPPTPPRSTDGKASSGDEHPHLLSLGGLAHPA